MGSKQAKIELENDQQFVRQYKGITNRQTGEDGRSGSSASVQRRACIGSALNRLNVYSASKMLTMIDLERYFNEKWNLCPYGLATPEEMAQRRWDGTVEKYEPTLRLNNIEALSDKEIAAILNAPITKKEIIMQLDKSAPALETKFFIFGVDASALTDDQIVAQIFEIEKEISRLEAVKNKPKKLTAKIGAMDADIAALVKFVDDRK